MEARLSMRLANAVPEIGRLKARLAEFGESAGLPPQAVFDLQLACEELIENVIKYGYSDDAPHKIEVEIRIEGDLITAELSDDGRPFDPTILPAPDHGRPVRDWPAGGFGLALVRRCVDDIRWRREGERNRVTIARRLDRDRKEGSAPWT